MRLFCGHDFEIIDKTILPSAFEQIWEVNKQSTEMEFEAPPGFYRKKLIILLKCKKCSKLLRIVEINP